ncbi:hypothetical protein [Microbacterium sp. 10M-3C3]|jgi:DNA-binding TFAR19-related protein (PDSD5 family)|uniref:hypothetical protein n=1 Tax=Microbacterium sp. 10M-3C3 TaxID=2483401 RepID=UPI000F632081|nr:hypothetical protein [Microbacterium sp. 10M-3C3]
MKPFRRTPPRDATTVSLEPAPGSSSGPLQIRHPEALSPVLQPVLAMDPFAHVDELRALVIEKVGGLAAARALDQDTLDALMNQIRSWRATWEHHQRQQAESRRKVAAMLLAQIGQNLTTSRARLARLRVERDDLVDLRNDLLARLGFSAAATRPAALEELVSDESSILDGHLPPAAPAAASALGRNGGIR